MNILDISIIIFCIMELLNVIILYYFPDSKLGNGVAVFNQWHISKEDNNQYLFNKYMVNWVAGVKLIFILLLIVILILGDNNIKLFSNIIMVISIGTYYFKLHPIIRVIDNNKQLTPINYSKSLFIMITCFILLFSLSIIYYLF